MNVIFYKTHIFSKKNYFFIKKTWVYSYKSTIFLKF